MNGASVGKGSIELLASLIPLLLIVIKSANARSEISLFFYVSDRYRDFKGVIVKLFGAVEIFLALIKASKL